MDAEQFLARVIGPGSYAALAFKNPTRGGMGHRFYPRDKLGVMASFARWISGKGNDVYFACAGFSDAIKAKIDAEGRQIAEDARTASNAESLRALWVDIDVKRPGDNKSKSIYADRREALAWLLGFTNATGLPPPNLWVDSGYGYHVYWVLEDALPRADWQPYADALAAAIVQHNFKCEAGITSDAARILRPPGTMNCKGGAQVPVRVLDPASRGDYPNNLVLDKLKPFLGIRTTTVVAPSSGVSALASGGPAAAFGATSPNMNAAAQANLPAARAHEFAMIATRCEQVKQALAVNGNGYDRPIWYLGFLSLAHHCSDGANFTHEISKGDPRYTAQETDKAVAQIAKDKLTKDIGPPRCTSFDKWNPGVCGGCPFAGKVPSPWSLGADDGDLPSGYQRKNGQIEQLVKVGDLTFWTKLVAGDVYAPILDRVNDGGGFALSFTYKFAGRPYEVRIHQPDFPSDAGAIASYVARQHVVLDDQNAVAFRRFILAWIEGLRANLLERTETIFPWGYSSNDNGDTTGVAVGGTLYRPDGTTEPVAGGDRLMVTDFTPRGDVRKWREAFDAVCTNRIDLQTLVACSFGAPLMYFTGQPGLVVSAWSADSGVGKSSAFKVGQTVWSAPRVMSTTKDTQNSVNAILAMLRIMVFNWDEMQVGKQAAELVQGVMDITQGKGKRRLRADSTLRDVGEWQTLVAVGANKPLMDAVEQATSGTDASAARVLDYKIVRPSWMTNQSAVARIVRKLDRNYGHPGRIFIAWVATHLKEAEDLVSGLQTKLEETLHMQGEERLYIAGIAAIMAGAKIANDLGLTAFDTKGLYEFLRDTVYELRAARKQNMLVHNGGLNIEQVLAEFHNEFVNCRLIVPHFAKPGPTPRGWLPLLAPLANQRVEIEIGVGDAEMRINKATFVAWCRKKGLAPALVIEGLHNQYSADEYVKAMGIGTREWVTGRMALISVPLIQELAAYLPPPKTAPAPQSTVPAVGNKPRV